MGKQTICIGENKGADQLRDNSEADQRLCFRYWDSTIPPLLNSKISSFYFTGRFVSDLFGNHIVGFSKRWLRFEREHDRTSVLHKGFALSKANNTNQILMGVRGASGRVYRTPE